MEYCAGGDLHDYIKRQEESIPEDVVRRLFTQACLGVDHLHRNEIVHWDLKPLNLFLTEGGSNPISLKIGDLGSALEICQLQPGRQIGTTRYMAPESL